MHISNSQKSRLRNLWSNDLKQLPLFLFALLIILLQAGCSSSVLQLRNQIDFHRGEFRETLADNKEFTEKFLACTGQAHDEPASERGDAVTSFAPLFQQFSEGRATSLRPLTDVIGKIFGRHPDKGLSLSMLVNVLADMTNHANARIDVDKLKQFVEIPRQWHGYPGLDEDQLKQDPSRFARTLLAYNKAYFGDLSFTASPDLARAGIRGVVKVTSRGFVDRSGNALLFPVISEELEMNPVDSARMSGSRVDSQRVSADLMRIFLEAFFDAAYRVPAVHGATALRVAPNSQESSYPEFDADHPAISLEALGRVTRDALRAEAAVTSLVGKAVRGGSVFGTQNETVAATLETAAGVMAKKLVEHEGFCYYQVSEGTAINAARDNGLGYAPAAAGSVTIP
jgi:hypothetical protein